MYGHLLSLQAQDAGLVPRPRNGTELIPRALSIIIRPSVEAASACKGNENLSVDPPCACVCMHLHVSACIFVVHAGPEVAVLDWYITAQKQIQDMARG